MGLVDHDIFLNPGTYSGINNTNIIIFSSAQPFSIQGSSGVASDVIIDGSGTSTFLEVEILFGTADKSGAVGDVHLQDLTLSNVVGGLGCRNAFMTLNRLSFQDTFEIPATFYHGCLMKVYDSQFIRRQGFYGIIGIAGEAQFYNCLFEDNYSEIVGGGIFAIASHVIIQDCVFRNNIAGQSGAIEVPAGSRYRITGCLFEDNVSLFADGGAIASYSCGQAEFCVIEDCSKSITTSTFIIPYSKVVCSIQKKHCACCIWCRCCHHRRRCHYSELSL